MKKFLRLMLAIMMVLSVVSLKQTSAAVDTRQIVEEGGYVDDENNDGVSIGKVMTEASFVVVLEK